MGFARTKMARSKLVPRGQRGRRRNTIAEDGAVARNGPVVVAVTLQRLACGGSQDWAPEEEMVLDALRRSNGKLFNSSDAELGSYIADLDPVQLRGVVSNVKGIYHEMLFVAGHNADDDDVFAALAEQANQPGWDVEFSIDGQVIGHVQLKAVASPEHVARHMERYPEIEVFATSEVAALMPGVLDSGFKNAQLEEDVAAVLAEIESEVSLVDSAELTAVVSLALSARTILQAGRVEQRVLRAAMADMGVGLTTAVALEAMLG